MIRRTVMQVQIATQTVRDLTCDALIVGALSTKEGKGVSLTKTGNTVDRLLNKLISERSIDGEFKGNSGEILTIHTAGKLADKRVLVIGLGEHAKVDIHTIQRASAIAARRLQETGARTIVLAIELDRKSTRLNSSHRCISYAVSCLKKKSNTPRPTSIRCTWSITPSPSLTTITTTSLS